MRKKATVIEMALKEKEQQELEACERAVLDRLSESPARLKELDAIGHQIVKSSHPRVVVNRLLNQLLHKEQVFFDFSSHRYYTDSETINSQENN